MVKPMRKLTPSEMRVFYGLCTSYFKEMLQNKNDTKSLTIKDEVSSDNLTKATIEMVENGLRIAYADIENEKINGFIIARPIVEIKTCLISHFYVDKTLKDDEQQRVTLNLYKEFAETAKKKGITNIVTRVMYLDEKYQSLLSDIDFEKLDKEDDITYGKRI